jgi:isopenicillin-N N-acyltransferase-like protein
VSIDFRYSLAHTNHYLDPFLKPLEADWLTHGGSYARLQVAQELLDDFQGRVSLDHLKALCTDHKHYPRSVCAHPLEDEPALETISTIAAMIIEPSKGLMHFTGLHPCRQTFTTFSLA